MVMQNEEEREKENERERERDSTNTRIKLIWHNLQKMLQGMYKLNVISFNN